MAKQVQQRSHRSDLIIRDGKDAPSGPIDCGGKGQAQLAGMQGSAPGQGGGILRKRQDAGVLPRRQAWLHPCRVRAGQKQDANGGVLFGRRLRVKTNLPEQQ